MESDADIAKKTHLTTLTKNQYIIYYNVLTIFAK